MTDARPLLAITTGDPAGIGPEISLRVASDSGCRAAARIVLIGDLAVLEANRDRLGIALPLAAVSSPAAADDISIAVLDAGLLAEEPPLGRPTPEAGRASYAYIRTAIGHALSGAVGGVVTAPITKLAWRSAGIDVPGHTEVFGEVTGANRFAMMLYSERIAVGLVTVHQPLATVAGSLTIDRIVDVGELLAESVGRIRGRPPRLAVLGLNPHAGESGMMGSEEEEIVAPAIDRLRSAGHKVEGPLSPDTAFTEAARERYDAHVCLYHDQGLIPFKMLSFADGVNVTLGLPFPRTSPDHGTAYDLAGKGIASIGSMRAAVLLAGRLSGK